MLKTTPLFSKQQLEENVYKNPELKTTETGAELIGLIVPATSMRKKSNWPSYGRDRKDVRVGDLVVLPQTDNSGVMGIVVDTNPSKHNENLMTVQWSLEDTWDQDWRYLQFGSRPGRRITKAEHKAF